MLKIALALFAVLIVSARPTAAQSLSTQNPTALVAGPWQSDAVVGIQNRSSAPLSAPVALEAGKNAGQPIALMAVGGAAILVGALVGNDAGTVIMVSGAVIGLYGLYLYLR